MAFSRLCLGLTLLAILIGISLQQHDPLNDFCRRFGHQTTIIDHKLYIDGGLLNWNPLAQNPLNYTNTWLLYNDFTVDNQGMPQEYDNLTKGSNVPSVQGGVLWADPVNKLFYLYGGEYYQTSPDSFTLWSYDVVYNTWNATSSNNAQILRTSFGAGVADEANGMGYYYGGWLSNASVPAWGAAPMPTSNLIIYDMIKNYWTNNTGPDSIPRAEGVMVYLPVSDGGMLVYFGGLQFPYGPGNYTAAGTATGNVPDMRRRFCAGATWAQDRSSYNIYLYGGASMPPNTNGFDDVYILTLPSFTWIKWWPTTQGTAYPHHSLTCNVVNGAQMIVMGGTFPNYTACDAPSFYGLHNLNLGKQNAQDAQWYQFLPNVTSYSVPSEIIATIGGQASGGATMLAPASWGDRDLPTYFTRPYNAPTRTATRSIPASTTPNNTVSTTPTHSSKPFPTAAVAGGAAGGGVLLLICVAAIIFFCLRMRQMEAGAPNRDSNTIPGPENSKRTRPEFDEVPATPIAELATTSFVKPRPKYDDRYSPHLDAASPGPEQRRTYSYSNTPQGSPPLPLNGAPMPGFDPAYSQHPNPMSQGGPQPYYSSTSPSQPFQNYPYFPPPPPQQWPADEPTQQPYYPPPQTFQENSPTLSPPAQYHDPDYIYPSRQDYSPRNSPQHGRTHSGAQLAAPASPHAAGSYHSESPHPSPSEWSAAEGSDRGGRGR
ncbi:hypothetical protein K432DRAFT_472509 [Lepidopterella palustris CBS 459.81]|uniref:Galactose oxidase n=1 Tax=Lepidopterella palustris CBS 459.81 TaxID=1314670 RepID=A0A8E2JHB5_9PEZI|nr:hypothetical protein K432DRAFT_472509 [Lepidopterella palustris CBS 459.81]